jgi:hypothetical protein
MKAIMMRWTGKGLWRWLWAASVCLRAAGAGIPSDQDVVLRINTHPVSHAEFRWFMEQERAGVVAFFMAQHNLEYVEGFWNHDVGGTTPKAILRKRTVDRLVQEKVEQILFQELGLVQDIRYAAFLEQLERSNREREQAAKEGKGVYGPIRYTQLQFYGHWKATFRAQAAEKMAQKQWPATEDSLRKFYGDHRSLFRAPPSASLEVVTVQAGRKLPAGNRADSVQSAARKVLARLKAGEVLPGLLKDQSESEDVKVSGQRLEEINADRMCELFPAEDQLKTVLALAPGESALLTDSEAQIRVVRCLGKAPGEDRAFEAVQRQVRDRWLGQKYDRHLERLAAQAQVQLNQEAVDRLLP